ncbi:MAG: tRNA pseudouridine(55) synthase TruB [Proteobacteria bacterium]|nr:tRNA pseudouridine(55) synthase TruB [Pseudomonadota bacterium]
MSKTVNSKKQIHGILLLNKSEGITSNTLLQKAKRLYKAAKAGHTGTLDPLATGMLPLCFGEATKFSQYLLDADKCYEATGILGQKTSTADSTGEIVEEKFDFDIKKSELEQVLQQFRGKIKQIPSMYSALKHEGVPLYKLARNGIEVERKARDIEIYSLELIKFNGNSFDIKVRCSKGTYIRNLVEDIGERLGVGAHVSRLHRCYTAGFNNQSMYTLQQLEEMGEDDLNSLLLPVEKPIEYLPRLNLADEDIRIVRQGQILRLARENGASFIRLYDKNNMFVGMAEFISEQELKAKKLIAFNL